MGGNRGRAVTGDPSIPFAHVGCLVTFPRTERNNGVMVRGNEASNHREVQGQEWREGLPRMVRTYADGLVALTCHVGLMSAKGNSRGVVILQRQSADSGESCRKRTVALDKVDAVHL